MLSLVLGSEITSASVAAIASSYSNLELLGLSGSSISDSGIGMICNMSPETLSRLLLALYPNISSSGIQFATAQLPLLELMNCGKTIYDPNFPSPTSEEISDCCQDMLVETIQNQQSDDKGSSSVDVLKLILSQPEVDVNLSCGLNKSTALHCVAPSGSVVQLLLSAGVDSNFMDANGHHPVDVIIVLPKFPGIKACLEELLMNNISDHNIDKHNLWVSIASSNSKFTNTLFIARE
ncbi:hypothetical protein F0562_022609 [Nyssa sinensis]|uniref:Uncharacterized protein n=1 Tax=Nyssa sinensis TaxID=561372 RepID=A0A5J5BS71_9ASTE|nr:hypothetical protein F0562_022609 [Nyssa sinensis]